jgi:hypothetical protein
MGTLSHMTIFIAFSLCVALPARSDEARPREDSPPALAPAVGSAAATTQEADSLRSGLELFARYGVARRDTSAGAAWDHAFDVTRVHAALAAESGDVSGRLVLEAVRSATDGALVGVATDSLLLRLREAHAGLRAFDGALALALGVVPQLTIPALESVWGLRVVAPTPLEASGLATPADLGARATLTLPRGLGWAGVVASSGEGYTARELNRGKNTEVAVELHPLPASALAPLALFASGVWGSQGVASTRAHRLTGGLLWRPSVGADAGLHAGLVATAAFGVDDAPDREALLFEAFARFEPSPWALLGARLVHHLRDRRAPADSLTTLVLTGGARLAPPLSLHLAASWDLPASEARAALPGSDPGWSQSHEGVDKGSRRRTASR